MGELVKQLALLLVTGANVVEQKHQNPNTAHETPSRLNGHFRVRKISDGVGVERVFPFHLNFFLAPVTEQADFRLDSRVLTGS